MRKNRFLYILLVIVCVAFSAAYSSRISAVLLVAVLAYPLLAFVMALINVFCVSAGFTQKRAVFEKNELFELGVYIKNRFIFACAPVELVCSFPDIDTGLFSEKAVCASLPALGGCRISVKCMHKFRGCFNAEIRRVYVCDPLRIIRLSRKLKESMTLVFLPRKIVLKELMKTAESDRGQVPASPLSKDREDFSHVREYRLGDIMQLVHWKLTAKQDELMIKQFDEITDKRVMILCDYSFEGSESGIMQKADGIIEAAIAFAMSAADAGVKATVDFGTYDEGFVSEITDRRSFDRFYELMSVLPPRLETADFPDVIELCRPEGASVVFLITGKLTEKLVSRAENMAEHFAGIVVLAYINSGGDERLAENKSFVFLNIKGSSGDALAEAVDDLVI